MSHSIRLTRRRALAGAAALPLAGMALAAGTRPARAGAAMLGPSIAPWHRFTLGEFEVTTLLSGTSPRPDPHGIFGLNVSEERFREVSEAAMLPTDVAQFFFTPTVVNTGAELILFDTGLNPGGITAALEAAGYTPEQVDTVVITHMHGDHIGGMQEGGNLTFANARYVTGAVEHNWWSQANDDGFNTNVAPFNDRFSFLDPGQDVATGITALDAKGHTPGHMAFRIESAGKGLVLIADAANHPVWSLAHPDWEVSFDANKQDAAATRRNLLGMIAGERLPMIGYHMPFPAVGYVESSGSGFRYEAAGYRHMV